MGQVGPIGLVRRPVGRLADAQAVRPYTICEIHENHNPHRANNSCNP
jgi:hypothetical protein